MPQKTLVHIVPAVPPAFNGLSDYCHKLWEHWPQPRPDWACLAPDVPSEAVAAWPQVELVPFELSKAGLLSALDKTAPEAVVLHYVGYAYNNKGVPLWLPAALRAWKKRGEAPLCVMFHELWARGSPRQSAFWLQPLAKSIVVQLADFADSWVSSSGLGAQTLVEQAGAQSARGHIVPIGSAIEPNKPIDWKRTWPLSVGVGKIRLAIFGLPSNRLAVLRAHRTLIELLVEDNLLESIAMIGKAGARHEWEREKELREQMAPATMWREHYDLAPAQISAVLQGQHAALTHYPPDLLTKSSVYPAFCLHGLVTICHQVSPLMMRPNNSKIAHLELTAPHLASNASCALETRGKLCEQDYIDSLRAQIYAAAHHQLSWSSIVEVWKKALAV